MSSIVSNGRWRTAGKKSESHSGPAGVYGRLVLGGVLVLTVGVLGLVYWKHELRPT